MAPGAAMRLGDSSTIMMKLTFSSICFFLSVAVPILSLTSPVAAIPGAKAVKELWQFPNETWVQNLAVRSNGKILVTHLNAPEVWQVDPLKAEEAFLVATFPNVLGASGITEVAKDVFVVGVANYSTKTLGVVNQNSCSLWTVDVRDLHPRTGNKGVKIAKITDIPGALILDGMVTLDAQRSLILVAASHNGWIYRVNTLTGDYKVIHNDTSMSTSDIPASVGVSGIRIRDGFLYYSAQNNFGRVKINPADGTAAGPYYLVATSGYVSDFDLDPDPNGVAYTTDDPFNDLRTVAMDGSVTTILGNGYSTLLAGDNSARLARTRKHGKILYITTNGGIIRPVNGRIEGGKVLAVNLTEIGY